MVVAKLALPDCGSIRTPHDNHPSHTKPRQTEVGGDFNGHATSRVKSAVADMCCFSSRFCFHTALLAAFGAIQRPPVGQHPGQEARWVRSFCCCRRCRFFMSGWPWPGSPYPGITAVYKVNSVTNRQDKTRPVPRPELTDGVTDGQKQRPLSF